MSGAIITVFIKLPHPVFCFVKGKDVDVNEHERLSNIALAHKL
jgi:hypothetical protein